MRIFHEFRVCRYAQLTSQRGTVGRFGKLLQTGRGTTMPLLHMFRRIAQAAAILVLAATVATAVAAAATTATQGWSTYKNERFGFQISYPGGLFLPQETPNIESGALWATADNSARLIATAAPNDTGGTLASYREFVMGETYAGAKFDYTPIRNSWFVLSGSKDDNIFYERIDFVCDGRFIYGWQINYPASQRRKFDLIVDAIHRSYKVGRGDRGACGP